VSLQWFAFIARSQLPTERKGRYLMSNQPSHLEISNRITVFRKLNKHVYEDYYKKPDDKKYGGTYAFATPGFVLHDPHIFKNVLLKDLQFS
jgi:hypothetical protein